MMTRDEADRYNELTIRLETLKGQRTKAKRAGTPKMYKRHCDQIRAVEKLIDREFLTMPSATTRH